MKRLFTSLFTLLVLSNILNAQLVPNGNFEAWEFDFAIEADKPESWRATYDYFNEDQPVVKSSDAFEGDASALVQCPTFGDSGIVAAIPFSDFSEDALIGYFKSEIDNGDSASIVVQYFDGKNKVKQEASFVIKSSVTEWTFFQLKLNKANSSDSIRFAIYPSLNEGPRSTSKIWIDDLSLSTYVNQEELTKSDFSVYPNPTQDKLFIEVAESGSTVEIISLTGKVVASFANVSAHNNFAIDTAPFENGMYLINVTTSENSSMIKTVIFE
ncbi:MAG: T9SS type A sorting domain-containing protein [Bacteroidia bacterium]